MRRRRIAVAALLLTLPLLMGHTREGCGETKVRAIDADTFEKISKGQDMEEVRSIAGEADSTTSVVDEGVKSECWVWDSRVDGKVVESERYWVCFADGKVASLELRTGDDAHHG